jgi:hypothetical protein
MTFLNPLVLFGLIAASIPIIIHLLNLRRLKVVEFSSIQFLKEMQKNKMRRIKIKQLLLLILRTLAIVFLVLSFSRPTLKNVNLAGLGSEVKNTMVIFIDDTPSMSVVDKNGEYLSQAKKIAMRILEMSEEGDEIYLIKFSELNPLREKYEPTSKSLALKQIESLEISDVSKNFMEMFISLSKILEQSKNLAKEVYVLTDFQKSNVPSIEQLKNIKLDRVIDSNTRIYFFRIGEKDCFNVSVDSISVVTKIFEINKPLSVSAIISNNSSESASNVSSELYLNDKKIAQKGIDLSRIASGIFTFSGQIKDYGFNSGRLEIEDDDFAKDNVRYFNFYVPEKIKVLMVSENPSDLVFINLVLSQTLDENSEPIFSITQTTTQFFSSYKPENFDVLIISSPEKIFNLNLLKDFIQKGGTAIILPGENSTSTAFNKALEQLGLNQIEGVSGSKESKTSFTRFKKLEFGHPIFSGIFSEKTPERIESPKIFFSFNYKPTLNGKEIITLENNYSFLCEEKIGAGSVLLFSSAMSLNWNEFPLKPIFAPLINRITLYSNSFNSDLTFIAGEEAQIKLKRTYNDLRLIEPDGKELIISQDTNKDGLVNLGRLEKIGNYKLMSKDELIGIISVNIDKKESILQKLDESVLRDFNKSSFPDGRLKVLSADVNPTEIIKQERYGTELWKLFLILVLICLVFEMIIAKSSKKDLIDLQKGNGV